MASLYDRLGGKDAIAAAVDQFYEKVLADETVNHFFTNTDMEKQRDHQTKFLTYALGGPNEYGGTSMKKAHEGMNIQPEHFNAIAEHLADTLTELGVEQADIEAVMEKISGLAPHIIHQ
ncbi:group I truncated hemoglobin [Salisediminibacterium halotolerans]|uniref:Group 1 truncated hemoglobin n=1 Tax=Salisediminibacterium halotolerans TaxID=517425 RepID=A0A1H9WF22_9BACI|nr:group 1 truncated hemoglobin [Salisediminibacterium haloalkalitolerans]SES32053.1 hemoglobin [Salisediminibacterium haloalkalitolerans]